jgi:hypothetical protein
MPLFPAAKMLNGIVGIDVHAVAGFPVHPYVGMIFLWMTPQFPKMDVFINGMPACTVGGMGYSVHIPQGAPVPPTPTNIPYWKRYLINVPMVLVLVALTVFANMAIAFISSLIPKPKWAEDFLKDVTGIDTSQEGAYWESVKENVQWFSQWQIWVQFLMPPLPFPGAQGSMAVGSPNVQVNGGALAFCLAPLCAVSCSDIPIVPNAMALGFSNVMVGVSFADLVRSIAVSTAQNAIFAAVDKGVSSFQDRNQGRQSKG